MGKRRLSNYWLFQLGSAFAITVLFLLANIVPRAVLQPLVSHDGELAPYSNGELFYGWPKTTKIITITQAMNFGEYLNPGYSFKHFLKVEQFRLATIQQSELAILSNVLLLVSILLLVAMGIHCLLKRRYSMRMLLAAVILVAIATSSTLWDCSL